MGKLESWGQQDTLHQLIVVIMPINKKPAKYTS